MKNNFKKYLIFFILFILIIFCIFLVYNKNNIDSLDNGDNDLEDNSSEKYYNQLFSDYLASFPLNNFNMIGNNYSTSNLTQNMIDDYVYSIYKYIFMEREKVSYDEINNYINHIFGDNFNVTRGDTLYNKDVKENCLIYDKKDMTFSYNDKCFTDVDKYIILDVIIDRYGDYNKKSIEVIHYYLLDGKIYCSYEDFLKRKYDFTYSLEENHKIMSDLQNNSEKYKCVKRRYTFNLKDNKYEFYSSEILNN